MKADNINLEERFEFSASWKKTLGVILAIGLVSFVIGVFMSMNAGHGHDAHGSIQDATSTAGVASVAAEGHGFSWVQRLYANLWVNNLFFIGLSIIGVFFVAIQYISNSGWSASIKRVPEAFGYFLPLAFILMVGVFLLASHDLFHWTHTDLYDKSSDQFDAIINGKKAFFFGPWAEGTPGFPTFFMIRMVLFIGVWMIFFFAMRKQSLAEDLNAGTTHYRNMIKISAGFIVFFAVSSSISAWDWVMSIDTHWFSTMFGWYVFASWFVSGLAAITLVVVLLKDAGYLSIVNENHLHDLGKYVFAFSIFWTYIWFSQFLLIYYANIPEETIYFVERLRSDFYSQFIFINLFLNFFFPFLVLMTRDAKRKVMFLKIVCIAVLIGHWFDFYLMIMPGTLKANGGFHFLEIGTALIYLSVFAFIVLQNLAKAPLIAKNHPMLEESMHHHI